jgi:hypothetical protein
MSFYVIQNAVPSYRGSFIKSTMNGIDVVTTTCPFNSAHRFESLKEARHWRKRHCLLGTRILQVSYGIELITSFGKRHSFFSRFHSVEEARGFGKDIKSKSEKLRIIRYMKPVK